MTAMPYLVSDSLVLARRNLAHIRQLPEKLIDVTLQPLMFVLLFAYVFGGVIDVPGGSYREYLVGGILVQTLAFGVVGPATSLATDLQEGIVDRIRSLPTSRAAFLLGHLVAELSASVLAMTIMTISGLIVGWRIESGVGSAIAAYALLLLFAFTMLWIGMFMGVSVRTPDAVVGIGFTVIFPLTFVTNAFVPTDGLPHVLEVFAEWNPISAVVAAVRDLFGNPTATPDGAAWPLTHPVAASVLWCVAILAVMIPLTISRFRRRTTD
jgi:ABC transporter DrrB family efflux protein